MALKKKTQISDVIRHVFLAYLCSALLEFLLLPQQLQSLSSTDGIAQMSMTRMLLVTGVLTVFFGLLFLRKNRIWLQRWLIAGVFLLLSAAALYNSFQWGFFGVCGLIEICLIIYAVFGHRREEKTTDSEKKPHWIFPVLVGCLAVFFAVVISV